MNYNYINTLCPKVGQDPKIGKCPLVFQTLLPGRPCQNDGHCPGQEKCCSFASGSVCAPPIIIFLNVSICSS
uniref:WAP domain-containing protein n=1 Tax=Cyprinodon variegatus TaxID=28743 RepID=A0A3Q2E5X6_CYPVA